MHENPTQRREGAKDAKVFLKTGMPGLIEVEGQHALTRLHEAIPSPSGRRPG